MNPAALLSFAAALLLFCMGGMFLVIERAPGWERSRLSTLIALRRPGVRHLSKPFDREAFEALLG